VRVLTRILVAFEDSYHAYRETIAAVIRILRPETEVKSTTLEELEGELERFEPEVVICSGQKEVELCSRLAWIELSVDPTMSSKISVGGRHFERTNPTVEELLEIIDEVRQRINISPSGAYSPTSDLFNSSQELSGLQPLSF
jgi:hypothetical protein